MESNNFIRDKIEDFFAIRLDRKEFILLFVSIAGYLTWLLAFPLFGPIMANYLGAMRALAIEKGRVIQIFLAFMSVSSLSSGYMIDKTGKRLIFLWASTVVASILSLAFLFVNDILLVFPIAVVLGIVAGYAPTAWGTIFADHTAPEDRGRVMGMAVAVSMPIVYSFLFLDSINIGGLTQLGLPIIGVLYLLTLLTVLLKPVDKEIDERAARRSRGAGQRQIILYSAPLFLFYIVVGVMLSIVFPTLQANVDLKLFYIIWAIPTFLGALIAGSLLDSRGRKFPMILGLATTGVSLAILGILGINVGFVSMITLAGGFTIVVVSSFIIWADLAPMKSRGFHYGIGFALISLAMLLGLLVSGTTFGSVSETLLKRFMFFSAVALFLCIPPLIVAEDALPKEIIEKRQMEEHLKKARERMSQNK
jgi:MFS family permease